MGESTLKIAVSVLVTPKEPSKVAIAVDELAFYLKDSYDFNDDSFISQPLGFWSHQGLTRRPRSTFGSCVDAENSLHRVYRLEFHKASFLQRVTHPRFKMPYVVPLYRIEPKTLLGRSEVVDLG